MNRLLTRALGFLTSLYGAALILLAAYLLAVTGVAHKSPTFDELAHLTGGYGIWLKNDYRLLPDNGNLSQRWGALPSLWRHDRFPGADQEAWRASNVYAMGDQFFYQLGNNADEMMFSGRAMMALLIVVLGGLIYFWSRSLFGAAGATVSLVLFAFCPSVLGHAPLVDSDTMGALFFLASMGSVWRLLHRVNPANLLLAGFSLAGVFLAKASGVLILPTGAMLLLIRLCKAEPIEVQWRGVRRVAGTLPKLAVMAAVMAVEALLACLGIWAAFGFRYSAFADGLSLNKLFPNGWEYALQNPGMVSGVVQHLRTGHWLPEAYLYGLAMVSAAGQTRLSFLNGEWSTEGFRAFFPYAFSVKETIPFLLILVLAAAAVVAAWRTMGRTKGKGKSGERAAYFRQRIYAASPLWLILVIYGLFALSSNLNIGHRHLFPLYPPLFILAGGAGAWFSRRPGWVGKLVVLLLVWHVGEAVSVWPNCLTYFNEFAGGPKNGYRHLVDSSLDWGQDLPGLKDWLRGHHLEDGTTPVYLLYFGTARPEYYRIKAMQLPGFIDRAPGGRESIEPLKPGYYCLSATHYQGVYLAAYGGWTADYEQGYETQAAIISRLRAPPGGANALGNLSQQDLQSVVYQYPRLRVARLCAWLRWRDQPPEALIGNTILVFKLSADDLRSALEGPFTTFNH
jgi:hypothetical protein